MTHEEIVAALPDYHDGQLPPDRAAEIAAHAAGCAACRAALAGLAALSAGARENLGVKAPAGLGARALARAGGAKKRRLAFAVAMAVILLFLAGAATRRLLPGLFYSVQGMISGAAGLLGSGGGNK